MKNKKRNAVISGRAGVIGGIALLVLANAMPVLAVIDPNYLSEQAQISQEQVRDQAQTAAGIQAALSTPASTPVTTTEEDNSSESSSSHQTSYSSSSGSTSSGGEVLGVSTVKDHSQEYYNDLKASLLEIQKAEEIQLDHLMPQQKNTSSGESNISLLILAIALALMALMTEWRNQLTTRKYVALETQYSELLGTRKTAAPKLLKKRSKIAPKSRKRAKKIAAKRR
jgi:hypothetical protein